MGDGRFNCTIEEIDACPVQIQGPKSKALMKDLCGDQVDFDNMPFYGLAEVKVGGRSCVISQSGFSGEAGYEIYLRDATLYAEDMWNAVLQAGKTQFNGYSSSTPQKNSSRYSFLGTRYGSTT